MQKGDNVITDHPDSRSRQFVRSYGIVHEITKVGGVIIQMADGSRIKREFNSVAVYTHSPSNWDELFKQQKIVFPQPKQQMMTRRSSQNKRHI
ncbi:hypothetical protein [Desulfosediminicola sp.]|uniref:hypothetical protein n=1 Tax=Desulfosediminicola sp. TaxID=2886825 RepID=UPI003AF2BB0F